MEEVILQSTSTTSKIIWTWEEQEEQGKEASLHSKGDTYYIWTELLQSCHELQSFPFNLKPIDWSVVH